MPSTEQPRSTAATRRRERTREIITATRMLFDERGMRDAQIEDVARAVGINRAIVYRHFTGKEELFALTLVTYLDEVFALLAEVDDPEQPAPVRLRRLVETFSEYGLARPAFVDCAQSLMRRSTAELLDEMTEDAALRLGRAMSAPLSLLASVLRRGTVEGHFHVEDPDGQANLLYATALGALQLVRVGLLLEHSPGNPTVRAIDDEQAKAYLVRSAVALATYRDEA
ncbi:TetR/AcrR family transcriptional regulator [Nocardioides yefusunii]|uniref:TetR/AcrR family transcriptional regulator n=1 Tax=Nocardioides yefusunii TaxID=2500546 RepID=A0ABW1R1I5_9ACTN|nr:TetR/AcrR family transcriptional regulator [Nocardioides yefusunii]